MRIGIGITTYLRPDCLQKCVRSILKHTDMTNVTIKIADDSIERKGVAFRKNECLRALKDCDYVFLLDDDCYPIKDGWIENWVSKCGNGKRSHYLYMDKNFHRVEGVYTDTSYWLDCGGVFMFMSKKDIEKVGAFNEKFDTWGFEHAEWSLRCESHLGQVMSKHYWMLNNTSEYIYSEDYSNPNHKSSITNEEKDLLFKKNFPIFVKGVEQIYIPL